MYLEYDLRFGREGQPGLYAQVAVAAIANWFRFAKAELSSTLIMFASWKHGTLPKDLPKERSLHSIFDAHCADRRYVKTMALVYKGVPLAFCSYNRVNECNQDFSPIEFCATCFCRVPVLRNLSRLYAPWSLPGRRGPGQSSKLALGKVRLTDRRAGWCCLSCR